MSRSKAIAVVIATACVVGIGACSSDDGGGMDLGMAGGTALAPIAGSEATAGAGAGGAGGVAGVAGAAGFGGAAGGSGAGGSAGNTAPVDAGQTDAGAAGSDADTMLPTSAIATLIGQGGQTVHGTAMFTQSGMDVALVVTLADCMNGVYPVHIHEGTSCADATAQGMHWDGMRGEGVPAIVCDGGSGIQTHARMAGTVETTWSIATAAADDIVGRVVVVHGATAPVACGVIVAN